MNKPETLADAKATKYDSMEYESKADCGGQAADGRIQAQQPSRKFHLNENPLFYERFLPLVLARVSSVGSLCGFWIVGGKVVIQFGYTDPVVCFQWIVDGVDHLATEFQ